MSKAQRPQTQVRRRVTDDTETKFDRVNGLIDNDVAKVKLQRKKKNRD